MAEINRRSVLIECLAIMREELQICSKNWNGLEPKEGMEEAWQQGRQKIEILKEMIQSLSSEPVRRALADWQKELMVKGIQTQLKFDDEENVVSFRDEGRYQKENLLDHQEER